MNLNVKTRFILPLFLVNFLILSKLQGQDLHYSQFYNSPQNYNPAQVGMFAGDHRFIFSLRDQWRFVPVPWFTMSGAYDRRFEIGKSGKQFIGGGVNFNYDFQGTSRLNLTALNLSGSYQILLSKKHIVGAGLLLGFATRGFNFGDLTWDKQWNGDSFDPNLPTGENFDAQRVTFLENAVGLNYRFQQSSRTYADLGGAMYHVLQPAANFYDVDNTKLPRHLSLTGIVNVKVLSKLDVQAHGLYQNQGEYKEIIYGGLLKYHLNDKPGKVFQIHAGLGYRTAKSLFPTLAIQYNEIYASFSYDIDRNEFNRVLNSNRGGPELHVRYVITNVKPLNEHKACPIY